MNDMLKGLEVSDDIEKETDYVGGYTPLGSDTYNLTINNAWLDKSSGGALGLFIQATTADGKQYKETFWVTSKKGVNYWTDKKGKKQYLPGFNQGNGLCLLTIGKNLRDLTTTPKTIKLYNFEHKKEIDTEVDMLCDLDNAEYTAGILNVIVDVTTLDEKTGKYVPTGKTKVINETDKIFRKTDGLTVTEIRAGRKADDGGDTIFKDTWTTKWQGQSKDKSDKKSGIKPGAPKRETGKSAPADPLFGGA